MLIPGIRGVVAAALTLALLGGVDARPRGAAQTTFNNGKSQANVNFFSYPLINVIKAASGDIKEAGGPLQGAPADPSLRDANGWPKSTSNGWQIAVDLPSSADRPGNWIQTWSTGGTSGNTAQNLITAVAYTITAANNNANATITINLASPISPNIRTTNQLKAGQCIQIAGSLSGGTWNGVSGNIYKVLDPAVGADPTKVQIDLNSTGLGTFSSGGQVKNALVDTTTAAAVCSGRYVFTPPSNGTFPIGQLPGMASLGSSTTGYARDVALYYDDEEAVYLAGQVWSSYTIAKLRDLKVGYVRSLDLQLNNIEKTVDWATRKPASYATYNSPRWIPASVSPSGLTTNNSGCAYSLTWPGYSLVNNAIVHVFFNAACAGAATLDVGVTGAKNILNNASGALSSGTNTLIKGGTTDSYATLIYKSSLNAWIKTGGDNQGSSGYATYIPPELIVSLATAVGAHPYVLTPALDDTGDWSANFATYVRDNGPSWMKVVNETTNETFNNAAGFDNNGYAIAQQLYENGGWNQASGAPSGTTYSVTAVTTGATSTITFNVAFTGRVGAFMQLGGTFGGVSGLSTGQLVHVTAINVGGNPNRVTVDAASSGTWTSGGTAVANPGERYEWVGTQAARMAKAVRDVYSGNTARYDTLLGIQTATGQSSGSANSMDAMANSPQFVLQGGWAAKTYLTAGAPANYIKSSEWNTSAECCAGGSRVANWAPRQFAGYIVNNTLTVTSGTPPNVGDEISAVLIREGTLVTGGSNPTFTVDLSQTYASSGSPASIFAGVPATRRTEEAGYVNAATTGSDQENLNTSVSYWLVIANWLSGKGINKMYAYEGGPTAIFTNYTQVSNTALDMFRSATVRSSAWQALIQTAYSSWALGQYPPVTNQYPGGFTAIAPSQFYFAGSKPRSQAWSMRADIYEPDTGLYLGIKAYNQ